MYLTWNFEVMLDLLKVSTEVKEKVFQEYGCKLKTISGICKLFVDFFLQKNKRGPDKAIGTPFFVN